MSVDMRYAAVYDRPMIPHSIRRGALAALVLAALLLAAVAAPAAESPVAVQLSGSISPPRLSRPVGGVGTNLTLKLRTVLEHPADSTLQLQKVVYKLPKGAVTNGKLFPSCSADVLSRARGRLSVCPDGSRIGSGVATGTAVDIGVTSSGRLTLFNGPGGRSITLNVSIVNPALVNMTVAVPLRRASGRYGYVTSASIPPQLQTILDGPIVVRRIDLTTGATHVVRGVRRGYIEGIRCPSGGAHLRGELTFTGNLTSTADATVPCR